MSPSDDAWYVESFGEDYLELYRHRNLEEARKAVALAASVLNLRPDVSILDLCCGAGRHIQAMRNRGLAAIGMDLSPVLLGAARRCAGAVSLVRGDMRHLPFRDRSFDAVLSFFTSFGYFPTDEENLLVLREVGRILRSGGSFLLDYLNRNQVLENGIYDSEEIRNGLVIRQERRWDRERDILEKKITLYPEGRADRTRVYREAVRLFSPEQLLVLLRRAGFVFSSSLGSLEGDPYSPTSPRFIVSVRNTG